MRRAGAAIVAVAVGGALLVPPASAVEDVQPDRIGGRDRFETAALIAAEAYPTGTDTVLIANGTAPADALAGAALAGDLGAPILLVEQGRIPASTSDAIRDLGASSAVILGGTAVVSQAVEDQLDATMDVARAAGLDRYETAADIARALGSAKIGSIGGRKAAIIARGTGTDFADALASSPLASAGQDGELPVLLVHSSVPEQTEGAIEDLGIDQVVIVGGTGAVSSTVEAHLELLTGAPAIRYGGQNRYDTATILADALVDDYGFEGADVYLANGFAYGDALPGGPLAALRSAPLLLTAASPLSAEPEQWLRERAHVVERVTALGGSAVITADTLSAAEQAAEAEPPAGRNESLAVTPADDIQQANGTSRDYQVTDLDGPVDIVLVECANVSTTADRDTVFTNEDRDGVADRTARSGQDDQPNTADVPAVRIGAVNGTARAPGETVAEPNDDYANNVAPTAGTVTFTVTSSAASGDVSVCVTPIVFFDANGGNSLNAQTTNPALPVEDFGVGGQVTFQPAAATAGTFPAHNVTRSYKGTDSFSACVIASQDATEVTDTRNCRTFRYDSNDAYYDGETRVDMAAFEGKLSPGDDVQGNYATDPSGVSTFRLTDEAPVAPTNVKATSREGSNDVDVSWTDSSTATNEAYIVFRALGAIGGTDLSPTCTPDEGQSYGEVGRVTDTGTSYEPQRTWTFHDVDTQDEETYCYVVAGFDDGDEGDRSAAAGATTGQDPVVLPLANEVVLQDASGTDTNTVGTVDAGDVHVLVFDREVQLTDGSSYTFEGAGEVLPYAGEIICGGEDGNADCSLSEDRKTVTAHLATGAPRRESGLGDPTYPLTIESVRGFTDAHGEPVSLDTTRGDRRIESAPVTRTVVLDSAIASDPDSGGSVGSGDVHTLTFSEAVVVGSNDSYDFSFDGNEYRIVCGKHALCRIRDAKVLEVALVDSPAAPDDAQTARYPVTVVRINGFTDSGGSPLALDLEKGDREIDVVNLI